MKYFYLLIFGLLFHFASSSQETWTIDNAHSNINFEVGWEDFSVRTGEFKIFEGTLVTDLDRDLTNAVFDLKVDPSSIDVIAENLSEQLKGDQFLNAAKYPEIIFHSSGAELVADSTYITKGMLKIHGIEKEQDVLVKFRGYKKGSRSYLLGLEVNLAVNRTDYGLDWGSPRLGKMVKLVGYLLYQKRIEEE